MATKMKFLMIKIHLLAPVFFTPWEDALFFFLQILLFPFFLFIGLFVCLLLGSLTMEPRLAFDLIACCLKVLGCNCAHTCALNGSLSQREIIQKVLCSQTSCRD